jgi:uncharacterized protein YjbJ (UPF0337 family)
MTTPTQDKTEGMFDQAKGKVKEGLGKATGNEQAQGEGKMDQAVGKVKEGMGNVKDKANDLMDKAKSN